MALPSSLLLLLVVVEEEVRTQKLGVREMAPVLMRLG